MPARDLVTVRDRIAWTYAELACAHAALSAGRTKRGRTDWMVRAKVFRGLRIGTMRMGSLYDDERQKLVAAAACTYCGMIGQLTVDHIFPRAMGGTDEGQNLVRACRECNSSKGKRDLLFWYKERGLFPPLLLLRRYLKLVAAHCERDGLLEISMADACLLDLPFDLSQLAITFPALTDLKL